MSITAAAPGTVATVGDTRRPVLVWQEVDGQVRGLVEDWELQHRGALVPAEGLAGFTGYAAPEATALAPAEDWEAVYREEDGSEAAQPLAGWAIADGPIVGLTVCDGLIEPADPFTNFLRYPPAGAPLNSAPAAHGQAGTA